MSILLVNGRHPICGVHRVPGNKNAALPMIAAAMLADGPVTLENVPGIEDVENMFKCAECFGAKISRDIAARTATIDATRLRTARVGCDYIEGASYLTAAAITGGEITLTEIDAEVFAVLEKTFARFEVKWTVDAAKRTLHMPARKRRRKMAYDLGDAIPSVADGPWPMFPSDLVSILIVLATQTRGTCLFFEKMFESRLYFVDHLIGMGAKIVQCDPHSVVVTGPTQLTGSTVTSPDIRAGIALILAALCAKGRTTILNAGSVDRGYEAVEKELAALGADAKRV